MRAFCLILLISLAAHARDVIVQPGESLSVIAERELGAASRWIEIARLNNISDPRALRVGMRLRLPNGEISPAADFIEGSPSVRRTSGAVRYLASSTSPWVDLAGATALVPGSGIKTARPGAAEIRVNGIRVDVAAYSILWVNDVLPARQGVTMTLELGGITARSQGTPLTIEAAAASARLHVGEIEISVTETGVMRVAVKSGQATIATPDGRSMTLDAGRIATIVPGAMPSIREPVSPITLTAPPDNAMLTARDVLFEWTPLPGAREYRFILEPQDGRLPLESRADGNKIRITNIPEGRYTWRVVPVGGTQTASSPRASLQIGGRAVDPVDIAQPAPRLELSTPRWENGGWRLMGRTTPRAWITIGEEMFQADASGEFIYDIGPVDGFLVIGVEARLSPTGSVSRGAAYVAARPSGNSMRIYASLPSGSLRINNEPAPDVLPLEEGRNTFDWSWEIEGAPVAASGRAAMTLDLTAPQIRSVRTTARDVKSGDEVTILVGAEDNGTGLGEPSTAVITIAGPGDFSVTKRAERLENGDYVFRFSTPNDLKTGVLRVTRLEVADADGNAVILATEGAALETKNPQDRVRSMVQNILLIGVGALLGVL